MGADGRVPWGRSVDHAFPVAMLSPVTFFPRRLARALRAALLGVSLALAAAPIPTAATAEPPRIERCLRVAAPAPIRREARPEAGGAPLPASPRLARQPRAPARRALTAAPVPRFLAHHALLC